MKDSFIFWITWQLVMIGWTVASMHNEVVSGSYNCTKHWNIDHHVIISPWKAAIVPLALFLPDEVHSEFDEYCKDQKFEHDK